MIVVVPEAHAFDVDSSYDKNQAAIDEELFHDIIPFLEAHYNVSHDSRKRAIAGLSMGGLQSTETGIIHIDYFSWIGAFSPTLFPGDQHVYTVVPGSHNMFVWRQALYNFLQEIFKH
jgi:enterochelin esterase-like enzyme